MACQEGVTLQILKGSDVVTPIVILCVQLLWSAVYVCAVSCTKMFVLFLQNCC